jgi:CubicO group peptidase (beta-lactamase class C family)
MPPRVAAVTLRSLLTMTSGFADEVDGGASWDPAQDDAVRSILQSGSVQDPGRFWLYSSASTHLLTAVLAEVTGGSVLDFARRVLFEPLGIRTRPAYEGVERLPELGLAGLVEGLPPAGSPGPRTGRGCTSAGRC